jgi:hypothetical protein
VAYLFLVRPKVRALLVFLLVLAAVSAKAAESIRVEGVPVHGRIHDVSVAGIREAIADFKSTRTDKRAPKSIHVLSSREMRAFLPERDMGWIAIRIVPRGDPGHWNAPAWTTWGRAIQDVPEFFRFVRSASQVYAFPVILSIEREDKVRGGGSVRLIGSPRRDDKHRRLLGDQARRELIRLVGHERDWFQGHDDTISIAEDLRNVGFVFQRGSDELTLFLTLGWRAVCVMPNGENLDGSLEAKLSERLEEWKKRYAQPELASK